MQRKKGAGAGEKEHCGSLRKQRGFCVFVWRLVTSFYRPVILRLYLYSIFSPFGAIQSVRLLRDGAGACTGAALLKFGITEDAELAIRTISGNKLPDGVVLDVTVKTVRS